MINAIRNAIRQPLLIGAFLLAGGLFLAPAPAFAAVPDEGRTAASTQSEVCDAIGSGANCEGNRGGNLTPLVKFIVNTISVIAGLLAVIMIIVAGMKYITSGGDSNKVASAKSALLYAIIGLIVIALAQFIVRFVLSNADKAA